MEIKEEEKDLNIIFSIYFALHLYFDTKSKKEKFLNILKDVNPRFNIEISEDKTVPFKFDTYNIGLKSKEINKETGYHLSFIEPFNKLLNFIHTSLAFQIPLILEGQIGLGKKTAINYIAKILGKNIIYFSISNTTTVEDLF